MKRITNSGGALTKALIGRLRATFPNADIYPMYGLTEAFRSTWLSPQLVDSHPESMGRAIPHAEILVCRPDGSITDDDEPGELVHCGPLVAKGYWNDPARTAERANETDLDVFPRPAWDLLDFAREKVPVKGYFSVNQVIEDTVRFVDRPAALQNVEIRMELDSALPQVWGDADLIKQVADEGQRKELDAIFTRRSAELTTD